MSATTPQPSAMMSRLGGHLAISLGIALAIAGATSLPHWLDGHVNQSRIVAVMDAPAAFVAEGKFIDRMDLAAGEDRIAERPFTPATMIMPMAMNWPEPTTPVVAAPSPKSRSAAADVVPLPPRRDVGIDDRKVASGTVPVAILPKVEAPRSGDTEASPPADTEEGGWTRIVTVPAVKIAEAVSGTAGMAQAAGSWTLSQASGLLPRW